MASEAEIGWLAGIIDGEGCIYGHFANRHRNSTGGNMAIEIRVESTSIAMIGKVALLCKDIGVHCTIDSNRRQKGSTKESHRVNITRRDEVLKFLRVVRDYLVVKQSEADVTIAFYERFGDQRRDHSARATYNEKVALFDTLRSLKRTA